MNNDYHMVSAPEDGLSMLGDINLHHSEPEQNEICWLYHESIDTGLVRKITLRPGLKIWISDYTLYRETEFEHRDIQPMLQFCFNLSGHYRLHYNNLKKISEYEGAHQGLYYFNRSNSVCRVMPNIPVKSLNIAVYPEFFLSYHTNQTSQLPPIIADLLKPGAGCGCKYGRSLLPHVRKTIKQIADCRLE